MADSLELAMFVCQLDARECQEVTDRRLVSKWLPVSLGQYSVLWRFPLVPVVFLPSVWLVLGGQVHLVAWELDLIKCSGLVAWDMGHGSHFLSLQQRAEESQRITNSMAATGVAWHALQFTRSFACSLCETGISRVIQTSYILIPLPVLVLLSASIKETETEKYTKKCKSTASPQENKTQSDKRHKKQKQETGWRETEIMFWLGATAKCFPVGMCEDVADAVWLCHFQLAWFIGRCLLGWEAKQGANPNSRVAGGTAAWC